MRKCIIGAKTYPYLYRDSLGLIRVMVPVSAGEEISLDNTCKAAHEIKRFFGEAGVRASLKALRQDLQLQLLFNRRSAKSYQTVQADLDQIDHYLELIKLMITEVRELQDLASAAFPVIPKGINQALAESKQNAFAVLLSPPNEDFWTRFGPYRYFMTRKNACENAGRVRYPSFNPVSSLSAELTKCLERLDASSINIEIFKQQLLTKVASEMPQNERRQCCTSEKNIVNAINLIQSNYREMRGTELDLDFKDEKIKSIAAVCCYVSDADSRDPDDFIDVNEFISSVVSGCNFDLSNRDDENLFSHEIADYKKALLSKNSHAIHASKNLLIIKIQFYLVCLNIYCHEQGILNPGVNIGTLYGDLKAEYNFLTNVIEGAIKANVSIECDIVNFLNDPAWKDDHRLGRSIGIADCTEVRLLTEKLFNQIKESQHFDEFVILRPEQKGDFFSHQGMIGCDFERFCHFQLDKEKVSTNLWQLKCGLSAVAEGAITHFQTHEVVLDDESMECITHNLEQQFDCDSFVLLLQKLSHENAIRLLKFFAVKGIEFEFTTFMKLADRFPVYRNFLYHNSAMKLSENVYIFMQHMSYINKNHPDFAVILVKKIDYSKLCYDRDTLILLIESVNMAEFIPAILAKINYEIIFKNCDDVVDFFKRLSIQYRSKVSYALNEKMWTRYFNTYEKLERVIEFLPSDLGVRLYNQLAIRCISINPETLCGRRRRVARGPKRSADDLLCVNEAVPDSKRPSLGS